MIARVIGMLCIVNLIQKCTYLMSLQVYPIILESPLKFNTENNKIESDCFSKTIAGTLSFLRPNDEIRRIAKHQSSCLQLQSCSSRATFLFIALSRKPNEKFIFPHCCSAVLYPTRTSHFPVESSRARDDNNFKFIHFFRSWTINRFEHFLNLWIITLTHFFSVCIIKMKLTSIYFWIWNAFSSHLRNSVFQKGLLVILWEDSALISNPFFTDHKSECTRRAKKHRMDCLAWN